MRELPRRPRFAGILCFRLATPQPTVCYPRRDLPRHHRCLAASIGPVASVVARVAGRAGLPTDFREGSLLPGITVGDLRFDQSTCFARTIAALTPAG